MESEGIPVIDLIDGLKAHGPESGHWITPTDDPPNEKANALIAEQLED